MPAELATPLLLVVRERRSYREVADDLGLPPSVVAERLRRAVTMLRSSTPASPPMADA